MPLHPSFSRMSSTTAAPNEEHHLDAAYSSEALGAEPTAPGTTTASQVPPLQEPTHFESPTGQHSRRVLTERPSAFVAPHTSNGAGGAVLVTTPAPTRASTQAPCATSEIVSKRAIFQILK